MTARLLEHCEPGAVLVTEDAKRLVEKHEDSFAFSGRREVEARGLPSPVTTFTIG